MTRSDLRLDEDDALVRYLVVSQVCAAMAAGLAKTAAVEEVAGRTHLGRDSRPRRVGVRTVWRWLGQWESDGIAGLRSEPRPQPGSRLPASLLAFLEECKREDPEISVPEVIRLARVVSVVDGDEALDRTTVWRECVRRNLPTRRRASSKRTRQRPWRFPHRMQCVIADGKHFRAGASRAYRVAVVFLDNATRFVLAVVVGTAESAALTLRGLRKVIRRWGLMSCLYVDLGFDTDDLALATSSLGISLILGTKSYPEARGSIERFNRTMSEHLLCGWPGNPTVDPELMALERRVEHWAMEIYNHTPHEGLDLDTPANRFHGDQRQLVLPESQAVIDEAFVTSFERTVKNHNCISVDSVLWELPLGRQERKIQVFRNMISGELSVMHGGERVTLKPVDLTANAYQRRAPDPLPTPARGPRRTAADAVFERDHPPLVDADGNYHED